MKNVISNSFVSLLLLGLSSFSYGKEAHLRRNLADAKTNERRELVGSFLENVPFDSPDFEEFTWVDVQSQMGDKSYINFTISFDPDETDVPTLQEMLQVVAFPPIEKGDLVTCVLDACDDTNFMGTFYMQGKFTSFYQNDTETSISEISSTACSVTLATENFEDGNRFFLSIGATFGQHQVLTQPNGVYVKCRSKKSPREGGCLNSLRNGFNDLVSRFGSP